MAAAAAEAAQTIAALRATVNAAITVGKGVKNKAIDPLVREIHRRFDEGNRRRRGPKRPGHPIRTTRMTKRSKHRARRAPRRSKRRKSRKRTVAKPSRNVFTSRSGNLFPDTAQVVHRHSFTTSLNPTIQSGTTMAHLTYRLNDIVNYAETGTGGTHTAGINIHHVTEMSTYYKKSRVVGCKIILRQPNASSNVSVDATRCGFMVQGCYTDNVASALLNFREVQANKHPHLTRFIPVSHAGAYKTLSKTCTFKESMLKAKGKSNKQIANQQNWSTTPGVGSANGDKFEPFYIHYFLQSDTDNTSTDEASYDIQVDIEWIVKWTDPYNNAYAPVTT